MRILGLDPGITGGVCLVDTKTHEIAYYEFEKLGTECDVVAFKSWLMDNAPIDHCYIELVQSMPGQGVASTFKFGLTYGMQRAVIALLGIPFTLVRPVDWTRQIHQGLKMDMKAKERSLIAKARLFPKVDFPRTPKSKKEPEGLIDALLIAEYGRRQIHMRE